jgi:large subunit ribosomal protein L10
LDNPRPEKVAVVDEVRERLDAASAAILTEYRGLTVKDLAGLRRTLREAGGEYGIYKNTLVRFAARDLGLDSLEELLVGPTAIAFVDGDAAAVAKTLRDFARTNPNLVVKGGVLGSKVLTAADTAALAELPPREVLLARFAGGLAAPLQQFAGLLQALPRNLAYGLKALIEKGGAPGAPSDPEPAAAAEPAAPEPATEAASEPAADTATETDAPAEALASGETDQPAPTADDVHEAVEESTEE